MLTGRLRRKAHATHGLANTNHTTIETQTVYVGHVTLDISVQSQTTPATKNQALFETD